MSIFAIGFAARVSTIEVDKASESSRRAIGWAHVEEKVNASMGRHKGIELESVIACIVGGAFLSFVCCVVLLLFTNFQYTRVPAAVLFGVTIAGAMVAGGLALLRESRMIRAKRKRPYIIACAILFSLATVPIPLLYSWGSARHRWEQQTIERVRAFKGELDALLVVDTAKQSAGEADPITGGIIVVDLIPAQQTGMLNALGYHGVKQADIAVEVQWEGKQYLACTPPCGPIPSRLVASSPAEVRAVVVQEWTTKVEGSYVPGCHALRLLCHVKVIDAGTHQIIATKELQGGDPPKSVKSPALGSRYGSRPDTWGYVLALATRREHPAEAQ